jgi:hypothetical protein
VQLACRVLFGLTMKPHASPLVELGIPLLALMVVALIGVAIARTSSRRELAWFAAGAGLWLLISALLGASGVLTDDGAVPPRLLLLIVPSLGLPLLLAFSSVGRALGRELPLGVLVLFQGFRLPLELVMHRAAQEGTMPAQMAFSGYNFDIVTGSTALVVGCLALLGLAPRWLLLAWNALGTLTLVNILSIAVLSLPQFRAFGDEPARLNTWIAYFPFVWLPAGLVGAAVLGHVILWRRLWSRGMRGRAFAAIS